MSVAVSINPADPRVARLGRLAGWSTFEALGRVATLRARCVELGTDVPEDVEIEAVIDTSGTQLVRAGLGELTDDGKVRVLEVALPKTSRERTRKWRAKAFASQPVTVTVGDASVTETPSHDRHVTPIVTVGDAKNVTEGLACASESLSLLSDSDSQTSGASERAIAEAQHDAQVLAREAWAAARAEHEALRADSEDVAPWPRKPIGTAAHLLAGVVCELLDAYDPDEARVVLARRTRAAVAEARKKGSLEWFGPTQYWRQFWDGAERSRASERTAQPKARGSPAEAASDPIFFASAEEHAANRVALVRYLETQ